MPVVITEPAFDDIARLDNETRARIYKAIEKLYRGEIKPVRLKGEERGFKVKVGKYRILWKYDEKGNIRIGSVKSRKDAYRNLP